MVKRILLVVLLTLPLTTLAQVKATPEKPIDLDTFNEKLPFDIPLKFKREYKGKVTVQNVSVLELDRHGCPVKTLSPDTEYNAMMTLAKATHPNTSATELEALFPRLSAKPVQSETPDSDFKNNKTTIDFELKPLKPNKSYALILTTAPAREDVLKLFELAKLSDTPADEMIYHTAYEYDPSNKDCSNLVGAPFLFREFILQIKPQLLQFETDFDQGIKQAQKAFSNCGVINEAHLGDLHKKLVDCEPCQDAFKFLMRPDSLPQVINSLRNLTDTQLLYDNVLTGLVPLHADIHTKPTDDKDYLQRFANFKSSYNSLTELIEIVRVVKGVRPSPELDNIYQELVNIKKCFNGFKQTFDTLEKSFNNLVETISSNPFMAQLTFFNASTNIFSFDTRNEYSFTGDFGLIYYGPNLNNEFSPYLGVHVNFRYVDRNIPWRQYPNKTLLHKLSFHMGTTLVSLKKEGRTDNFFKNAGFMTGIGYRFGHVVRANAGMLWFQREDQNPLIDNKKLSTTPYVGISFDISVKSFMNGFNTFFN